MFDQEVTPNVTEFGLGEADLAVVCNVHGDEPTGAVPSVASSNLSSRSSER